MPVENPETLERATPESGPIAREDTSLRTCGARYIRYLGTSGTAAWCPPAYPAGLDSLVQRFTFKLIRIIISESVLCIN